jgi:carbon storage regulator
VLVLTRRAGESIVIGDDVRVVVLDVRGDTVRLGIDAPRSVQVHRAEVYAEVQAANAAAATSADELGTAADRLHRLARPVTARRPSPSSRSGVQRALPPAAGLPTPPPDTASPVTQDPTAMVSEPSAPQEPAPRAPEVPATPQPRPKPGPPTRIQAP